MISDEHISPTCGFAYMTILRYGILQGHGFEKPGKMQLFAARLYTACRL